MDHSSHPAHHEHEGHPSQHRQAPKGAGGHDKHAGHHTADFWKRFIICSIVSIPVLALSHMIQSWLGFELSFPGDRYVLAILSTFIFIYGGYPFLKGLYDELWEYSTYLRNHLMDLIIQLDHTKIRRSI